MNTTELHNELILYLESQHASKTYEDLAEQNSTLVAMIEKQTEIVKEETEFSYEFWLLVADTLSLRKRSQEIDNTIKQKKSGIQFKLVQLALHGEPFEVVSVQAICNIITMNDCVDFSSILEFFDTGRGTEAIGNFTDLFFVTSNPKLVAVCCITLNNFLAIDQNFVGRFASSSNVFLYLDGLASRFLEFNQDELRAIIIKVLEKILLLQINDNVFSRHEKFLCFPKALYALEILVTDIYNSDQAGDMTDDYSDNSAQNTFSRLLKVPNFVVFMQKLAQNILSMLLESENIGDGFGIISVGLNTIVQFLALYSQDQSLARKDEAIELQFLEIALDLLASLDHKLEKSNKPITDNQKTTLHQQERFCVKHILVMIVGNFVYGSKRMQDLVRLHECPKVNHSHGATHLNCNPIGNSLELTSESGKNIVCTEPTENHNKNANSSAGINGIYLLLNMTQIDVYHPFIREYAIATVKYLLEDNLENQNMVSQIKEIEK
ncbi:hypothetical protein BB561_006802 [Smittium simulii]|uniref:Ataxin-10 homolog n=1 Tax=Smittium simulii TaxID=133385 RepID=A0A2T9Y1I3_9FUNG|nr:hypothetical protein BB561_006802 [Smittium simulii]